MCRELGHAPGRCPALHVWGARPRVGAGRRSERVGGPRDAAPMQPAGFLRGSGARRTGPGGRSGHRAGPAASPSEKGALGAENAGHGPEGRARAPRAGAAKAAASTPGPAHGPGAVGLHPAFRSVSSHSHPRVLTLAPQKGPSFGSGLPQAGSVKTRALGRVRARRDRHAQGTHGRGHAGERRVDTDGHGPARDRALRQPGPHGCRQPGSESPGGPRAPPVAQAVLGSSDEAEPAPRPAVLPQGQRLPGGRLLARPGPLSVALSGAAALLTQMLCRHAVSAWSTLRVAWMR